MQNVSLRPVKLNTIVTASFIWCIWAFMYSIAAMSITNKNVSFFTLEQIPSLIGWNVNTEKKIRVVSLSKYLSK